MARSDPSAPAHGVAKGWDELDEPVSTSRGTADTT